MTGEEGRRTSAAPGAVRAAGALVGLEALAVLVAGIGYLVATLVGHPNDRASALVGAVVVLLIGVAIGGVALGLARCQRWARTPVVLVQFFAGVVVVYQVSTLPALSVPLAVVALAVVGLLLTPPARAAFTSLQR